MCYKRHPLYATVYMYDKIMKNGIWLSKKRVVQYFYIPLLPFNYIIKISFKFERTRKVVKPVRNNAV